MHADPMRSGGCWSGNELAEALHAKAEGGSHAACHGGVGIKLKFNTVLSVTSKRDSPVV